MSESVRARKKLIEVALPLEAINAASAREKSIRHGHPSTLHLWWARRPLAAARAVIFSQMVDDPSAYTEELLVVPEKTEQAQRELAERRAAWNQRKAKYDQSLSQGVNFVPAPGPEPTLNECIADLERERLFEIIRKLVLWENTTNEKVLNQAREEIWKSWRRACGDNKHHPRAEELFNPEKLPAFHDPFAGGGALPLEAQRLGLAAYASDLNPVAVLINKAMIEIPPKFAGMPPVNPESRKDKRLLEKQWHGSDGLAEDVRYYGKWMRDEAERRIGNLYPKVEITAEMAKDRPDLKPFIGQKLTVIAWLWARTVRSPNPAFSHVDVPLVASFDLSLKNGKHIWAEPIIRDDGNGYDFAVRCVGEPSLKETVNRRGAVCIMSSTPMPFDYVRSEAKAGRMGSRLMAVVAEAQHKRVFVAPTEEMEQVARQASPGDIFDTELPKKALGFRIQEYGMTKWRDLFTPRQLVALSTFSDLVADAHLLIERESGLLGSKAAEYAKAVSLYLALAIDKMSDYGSSLVVWSPSRDQVKTTFARQALAMVWDFGEVNVFAGAAGDFVVSLEGISRVLSTMNYGHLGNVQQLDAQHQTLSVDKVISIDPPYYDNIGYADLSDFFYVWLRRSLKGVFPNLLTTVSVPKLEELVAVPFRHGGKTQAEDFFLKGMTQAMQGLAAQAHPAFPLSIYYAFKQSETEFEGTSSTGWETFLGAIISAGLIIDGTWPMRTEREGRTIGLGTNALASSIVLVCRARAVAAPIATRREFMNALKAELPLALLHLQRGNIAPVDLAQAAIGPGMAIYTRYSKVVDAEGKTLPVREALALINQTLDEVLAEQEGDFDADTRWALAWFEQAGFADGEYGVAETLSKAKNTSITGLEHAGILKSKAGKVRLLRPEELSSNWDPVTDSRLTVWEAVHHLIRRLEKGGEAAAAELAGVLGGMAETARELAYRLYTICERKKRAQEALAYNALVQSWLEITRLAREGINPRAEQAAMFAGE